MKKVILLAVTLLAVAPGTSLAQTAGMQYTEASGSAGASAQSATGTRAPNPQDYVLREDGRVVIGGDVATDCPSFASSLEQGYALAGNPEQARSVLDQCKQAGLLPSGGAPSVSAPQQPPTTQATPQTPTPQTPPTRAGLPATGGPDLLLPASACGVLLVSLGVLGLAEWRRRLPT